MKTIISTQLLFFITINAFSQIAQTHPSYYDSINQARIGKPYQHFSITTLNGAIINNESLKGKVTLLSFWFKGCQPCIGEIPFLDSIYDTLKNNPNFLQVAVTFDHKETLSVFIKEHNIHYPIATTENSDSSSKMNFGNGYPLNLLIDKNGNISMIWRRIGGRSETSSGFRSQSVDDIYKKIKSLL